MGSDWKWLRIVVVGRLCVTAIEPLHFATRQFLLQLCVICRHGILH
jgi:hypothetical protein